MAFKTAPSASEVFTEAKNLAADVKQTAQTAIALFGSTANRDYVLNLAMNLREWRIRLAQVAQVPGIVQYAKDQYADQNYNAATEFTAMLNAIDAVISGIHSAFPVGAGGEVRERVLNADGSITMRTFTSGQLAGLVTLLQTLDSSISG